MTRRAAIEALRLLRRCCWRVLGWSIDAERDLTGERRPRIVVVYAPGSEREERAERLPN